MDYRVHGILQARILEGVAFPFSRGSSQPGVEPKSPTLQVDSLTAELQGKPKNTGVGSPLLQQFFLTQESNWGLLHCRRILYLLSYMYVCVWKDLNGPAETRHHISTPSLMKFSRYLAHSIPLRWALRINEVLIMSIF